ncbi:hypothetical protein O181_088458 [Austropuccinia psidii MF-1]|uniref:RNase H type-1 domain-containing protein n=1 Tax=Austropuccinia psidii MF-1 TaxID=1389203 RepID=A0A9Q3IRL4_9BASI|nr:hypothetical protein [Austropuccinia psidii MF-1]
MALYLCQELLVKHINNNGPPPSIAIFSDSQEEIKIIVLPKRKSPGQQLKTKNFNNFQVWELHFSTKLYWCLGHTGVQQNEEVDTLANEAARAMTRSPYTLNYIRISKLRQMKNQHSITPLSYQTQKFSEYSTTHHQNSLFKHLNSWIKAWHPSLINYTTTKSR